MSDRVNTPPGWPAGVRPPGAEHWGRSAVNWLLDQCPPEYRGHPVIVRHPLVLAWLAVRHAGSGLEAVREALARARVELAGDLSVPAMSALLETLQAEQVRLIAVRRGAVLLEEALRGHRYVPRL